MHNIETITVFNYNNYAVKANLEDITHDESLVSPPEGSNCINWIFGHIVVTRDELMGELGLEKLCSEAITKSYISGSKPVNIENAANIKILLDLFNKSQSIITEHLANLNLEDEIEKRKNYAGFAFHEAYHAGQLGILRRMLGKKSLIK